MNWEQIINNATFFWVLSIIALLLLILVWRKPKK